MKKFLAIAALIVSSTIISQAQVKEGTVTYTMDIQGLPAEAASMVGNMETKVYFKKDKSMSETSSGMGTTKVMTDNKGMLMTVDQMGQKYFLKSTTADLEKLQKGNAEPKIEYVNETKSIAGYDCKKAVITMHIKDEDVKTEVWYTDKIVSTVMGKTKESAMFKGLKGFPLEYEISQGPLKIKMTAKEVSTTAVPDSVFALSTEGFTELTQDDLKKMQGGGE
ncbi:DUF4412 domain-containing protein [Taibaiella soli]|uniref:DUF4412 domain-containing protein n=1 Tax=Taibaiella soli TaxID=1649169 RepID=A0A2W2ANR1_9BACT|nr:DUF4412 domain-containing protein [Taibaiella soli]PZF74000.1 hypothetical protein DN068_05245 [Taibaiella soli]